MSGSSLDPIPLQRLVDGEIDHSERAELLRKIDANPSQWRDVALALIEEQEFRRGIVALEGQLGAYPQCRDGKDREMTQGGTLASSPFTEKSSKKSMASPEFVAGGWWKRFSSPSFSVAASIALLLMGFAGGTILRGLSETPVSPQKIVESEGAKFSEAGKLRLVSEEVGPVDVPVYQVSEQQLASVIEPDAAEIEKLRQQLMRRGLWLDVQSEFFEGQLPDGRQLLVPVRNVKLRTIGQ